jgi:hypothetical protein
MDYGFTSLEPKVLEQIEGNDFEEFCEELLRFERDVRHPGAQVAGTAPRSTADAGKDLRLTTAATPTIAKQFFSDAVTEDHVGETYFSCKGGSGWAAAVLDDLQDQSAPLDVLTAGGHFTVLTHRKADLKKRTEAFANARSGRKRKPAKKAVKTKKGAKKAAKKVTATFEDAVVGILARRLKKERSVTLPDLSDRLHIYDGSHLAAFLKRHRPSISSRFAVRLGIRRLEYLVSLDQWEHELAVRGFPQYVPDPSRSAAIDALRVVLTSAAGAAPRDRAIWVHGAPGVGKSRMVLEALRRHPRLLEFERRVVVARSDTEGSNAIGAGVTEYTSDVILVVDECPAERVGDLSAVFLARSSSPGTAVVVMIGPRPRPDQTPSMSVRDLPVGPLDDDARRSLVIGTLGIEPTSEQPLVERVLRLCEGYPWSAVLIANALREDRNALPEGATHWDACELVLAGKPGDDLPKWHAETLRRARAVLAVMLTDGIDWQHVDQETMDRVALAVGLPSSAELAAAAEECDIRGLLRRRLEWKYKYVTPSNVARQVAIHLLAPPHHVARSIRAHCRELMSKLHEQLKGLDVPASILETLSDDELDALDQDPPSLARISRGDPGGATLLFVARHRPARTAAFLRRLVEQAETADWRANDQARFVLGGVLGDLSRRRAAFDDAEQALYQLTAEERRLGVTQSVNSWRSLFLVRLNPTYLPYADRLARLVSRLPQADPVEKQVAIRALEVSISDHEMRMGGDAIDGPWLQPTPDEARAAARAAWEALFGLLGDGNPDVASAARRAVLTHLRSGVRTGVGVTALGLLLHAFPSWPAAEHLKVREAVDQIAQYDTPWLDQDVAAKTAHERLLETLEPKSFHERLVDTVGRWRSWQGKTSFKEAEAFMTARDEELAREGLQGDVPLKGELDWLESENAPRGVQFMAATGRIDVARVLLPTLEERVRAGRGPDLAAAYLSGVAAAGGEPEVDALLRRWRSSPELALPTFLASWRIGPSDERISWLVEDVQANRLGANVFRWLMLGSWGARANTRPLGALARALLTTNEIPAGAAALSLVLARMDAVPEAVTELLDVLGEAVMSLATVPDPDTMLAYEWELACKKLHERGRDSSVISAAIEALRSSESVGFADRVWTVLHPLLMTHGAEIWAALTHLLENAKDVERILVDARGSGLMRHVPPGDVVRWIGHDRGRQIAVAEMCGAYEEPLNPLARALIAKYGAQSPTASVIAARAHSTPSAVSSLAQFARGQLTNARGWARDNDPEVALWGARMVKELELSAEEFDAHEEFEKRRRH